MITVPPAYIEASYEDGQRHLRPPSWNGDCLLGHQPSQYKMIYQPTEFRQDSDDFNRWQLYVQALILKQAKKMSKEISFYHFGAEIIYWIISPRTAQNDISTYQISPR